MGQLVGFAFLLPLQFRSDPHADKYGHGRKSHNDDHKYEDCTVLHGLYRGFLRDLRGDRVNVVGHGLDTALKEFLGLAN